MIGAQAQLLSAAQISLWSPPSSTVQYPYAMGGLKDNAPVSYDDTVRLQRERQERIEQYTRDLKRFYARYAELGEQKRVLLDQLMELTKAPAQ